MGADPPRDDTGERRPPSQLDLVRGYHQRTKHGFYRYAPAPPDLDWDNQPDPFRRWEGAECLPLPLLHDEESPSWSAVTSRQVESSPLDARALSRFLLDSMALSAWKEAGSARWSLRVNPSSGNLHPTEAHLLLPPVAGLLDAASVAHYAPREHALELRSTLDPSAWEALGSQAAGAEGGEGPPCFFVGLTSLHWRESWKYGERAYRYCQHDVGHALAALALSAASLGWRATLVDELSAEELGAWLGTGRTRWPEEEVPETLLRIDLAPRACPSVAPSGPPELEWRGQPSRLSQDHVEWEAIEIAAEAARKPRTLASQRKRPAPTTGRVAARFDASFSQVVRSRRSAVAMDAATSLSREAFLDLLRGCLPGEDSPVDGALAYDPRIHFALFVHRVEGLEPGLYWLSRDESALTRAHDSMRQEFSWRPVEEGFPLYELHLGNVRGLAARLSCQQEIAGDGAFSLGMIADFEAALEEHGAWFYPRLFWEAGALGQCLYLEAELRGLRGTGIGCYFDDPVHATLGLRDASWQSLYHFTIGGPLEDDRLRTLSPYGHLDR